MDERFLFPFEKIRAGSNVLIYGAGELGQSYTKQLLLTKYCNVVGMADKNYERYLGTTVKVYNPQDINKLLFDFIVLAMKSRGQISETIRKLHDMGVEENKIVYIGMREKIEWQLQPINLLNKPESDIEMAWQLEGISCAVFLSAGIGGLIIAKRPLMELVRLLPDANFDLYISEHERQMKLFFSDIPNINAYIYNLGTRYSKNNNEYDFSVVINTSGYLRIDSLKYEKIKLVYPQSAETLLRFKQEVDADEYREGSPRISLFQRSRFRGENVYTSFNYGVLNLDSKVWLPLNENVEREFIKLGLNKYITVNYGNGACKDISKVAKCWPLRNFNQTVALFKQDYPDIEVLQIGTEDAERIMGVDRYILGADFDLIEYVLKNALFHLDIEGGLVHLATQLGTKCIVLFGPTPEFFYGYKENINIRVGKCHDCCGVYLDSNRCARGMEEPECMYNITPEIVMEKIDEYLTSIL